MESGQATHHRNRLHVDYIHLDRIGNLRKELSQRWFVFLFRAVRVDMFIPNNPSKTISGSGATRFSFRLAMFRRLSSRLVEISCRLWRCTVSSSLFVSRVGAPWMMGNGFKSRIEMRVTKRWWDDDEENKRGKDDWVMFTHYHSVWAWVEKVVVGFVVVGFIIILMSPMRSFVARKKREREREKTSKKKRRKNFSHFFRSVIIERWRHNAKQC